MLPAVINQVNLLGNVEPSILTFINWRCREIGENPQHFEPSGDDDNSVVKQLKDEFPGVVPAPEDDDVLPGVDKDFDAKPIGVEVDSNCAPQESDEVNGLGQQDTNTAPTEEPSAERTATPAIETQAPLPKKGMATRIGNNLRTIFPAWQETSMLLH